MEHEQIHGHDDAEEAPTNPVLDVPRGNSSYGWVWIVGIIVTVAVILFFLQGRVPETNMPNNTAIDNDVETVVTDIELSEE